MTFFSGDNPEVVIGGRDETGAAFDSAKHHADEFASKVGEMSNHVIEEVTRMVAEFFALEKAVEAAVEGIRKADEIRDLQLSLSVFTGSTEKATQALEYFNRAAENTRNTGSQLATVFRDILPVAMTKGFSQQSTEMLTVMLSQLGTVAGKSLDEMEHAFQQLLNGRRASRGNPILQVLGITPQQMADLGWDKLVTKMEEVAKKSGEFGQSFDSSLLKIKTTFYDAFGDGFNKALSNGREGYQALVDAFKDPELLDAISHIGAEVAALTTQLANAATWWDQLVNHGSPRYNQNTQLGKGWLKAGEVLNNLATGGMASLPESSDLLTDHTVNVKMGQWWKNNKVLSLAGDTAPKKSTEQFGPYVDSARRAKIDFEAGLAALLKQASAAGKVAQDMRNAADEAKKIADIIAKATGLVMIGGRLVSGAVPNLISPISGDKIGVKDYNNELWSSLGNPNIAADLNGYNLHQLFLAGQLPLLGGGIQGQFDQVETAMGMRNLAGGYIPFGAQLQQQQTQARDAADAFEQQLALKMHDDLIGTIGEDFSKLFQDGGKHFVRTMSAEFASLMDAGAKRFAEGIFGHRGDGLTTGKVDAKGNPIFAEGHDPNQIYDGFFGQTGTKVANAALGFGSLGFSAFQGGLSGAGNARLAGVLGGAASGGELGFQIGSGFGIPGAALGAIAGAIVGLAASMIGEKQRRADYQYGIPTIGPNGTVIANARNLTDASQQDMSAKVQDSYDTYRNDYTRILMSLGVNKMPNLSTIVGKFQDNPSAHWAEHFQQWLSETLPRTIANEFKDTLKSGFAGIGLSGTQFDSMWAKYSGLDPAKAASMMQGLADALVKINDATKFFGTSSGARLDDINAQNKQTFAEALATSDTKILDFAAHLKDLVGEDQIRAAGQLGDMLNQRMAAEKQFEQSLTAALEQAHKAAEDLNNQFGLRLLHGPDGKPDYAAQARFLQGMANKDLAGLQHATNPQQAQQFWSEFLNSINQISSVGFNISQNTGDAFTKWAQDQLAMGQKLFDQVIKNMGSAEASQDALFLQQIQPSLDQWKNSLGGANVTIGDFGSGLDGATGKLNGFGDALDGATRRLRQFATGGDFATRTVTSRLSA